jgi:acyl-CoA reductase-like NAD-dependent aldehyde dehydrogenase
LTLELGGNAAFIVFDDADLTLSLNALLQSKFRNSGQTCIATNRVFLHEKIYDVFCEELVRRVENEMICGDGFEKNVTVGPLINKQALEKVIYLLLLLLLLIVFFFLFTAFISLLYFFLIFINLKK